MLGGKLCIVELPAVALAMSAWRGGQGDHLDEDLLLVGGEEGWPAAHGEVDGSLDVPHPGLRRGSLRYLSQLHCQQLVAGAAC